MAHCISLQWSEHESSYQQLALQGSTKHRSLWGASRTLSFVAGPTEEIFWLCVSRGGHWLSVLMYWICFLFRNFETFEDGWVVDRMHAGISLLLLVNCGLDADRKELSWSCARISPNYTETQFVPHFLKHWTILLGISHLEWFIEWYEHIYSAMIYRVYYGLHATSLYPLNFLQVAWCGRAVVGAIHWEGRTGGRIAMGWWTVVQQAIVLLIYGAPPAQSPNPPRIEYHYHRVVLMEFVNLFSFDSYLFMFHIGSSIHKIWSWKEAHLQVCRFMAMTTAQLCHNPCWPLAPAHVSTVDSFWKDLTKVCCQETLQRISCN